MAKRRQEVETVNEVIARGRIVRTGIGRMGYAEIRLAIRGYEPIYVNFEVSALDPSIKIGDYVLVKGYTVGYSPYDDVNGRRYYVQYFVATEFQKDLPELTKHFGVRATNLSDDTMFHAFMKGVIESVTDSGKDWGNIRIRVNNSSDDQRPSRILLGYHKRRIRNFDIQRGDIVCLFASLHTETKDVNGQPRDFEDLRVEDIVKVGESDEFRRQERQAGRPAENAGSRGAGNRQAGGMAADAKTVEDTARADINMDNQPAVNVPADDVVPEGIIENTGFTEPTMPAAEEAPVVSASRSGGRFAVDEDEGDGSADGSEEIAPDGSGEEDTDAATW